MNNIPENVAHVRDRIADACAAAGRSVDAVRLIAVTKFVDTARIGEAIASGVHDIGENRAQELTEKLTFFKQSFCSVHFIGQLQTNKIKYVCGIVELIHSVDRISLAEQLQQRAAALDIRQNVLLQVNVGDERQKGGISGDAAMDLLGRMAEMPNLSVCGFMCVPPAVPGEQARPYFCALRELLERAQMEYPSLPLNELSMGMTHDFEAAILEGATMVRVGTGIFGRRSATNV